MYLNGQRTEGRKETGKKKAEQGPLSLLSKIEELLERKVTSPV
jgi:hypothetical protein